MKKRIKAAVLAATAATLAISASTSAFAADASVLSYDLGAKTSWTAYGDYLDTCDEIADGHSSIGGIQLGATQYYYWNTSGNGSCRHVDLDVPENVTVGIAAATGDYQGTPTGGLDWSTLHVINVSTT